MNTSDAMTDDPTLLQDQDRLIEDSAARLFAEQVDKHSRTRTEAGEFDQALWQQVADAGFPLLLADERAGGFAAPWAAAFAVLRGIGYWQVPLPLAETLVAAQLASRAGFDLPATPLTLIEQGEGNTLQCNGSSLSGVVHGVPWARHAGAALVSLQDNRLAWLTLAQPGVTITHHTNHAGLPADTLALSQVRVQAMAPNPLPIERPVWTLGAIARSAMMVGALESALEQSVRYAGERVQFGKPIGKNQAIQQQLALMAGDVAAARMAALTATRDAGGATGQDWQATPFSAAVAKVRTGEAATRSCGIAHQVHGAIGFTHEHSLHFATRRLWAWREEFGTDAQWAGELGRAAIRARASGFWPALTRKQFA